MENYFKLRIPFATKKYIKKEKNGLIIRGDAYYIFDVNKKVYVDQYIEIIDGNYRITDLALIKTKGYYKNKIYKNFRDCFLDKYSNTNAKEMKKITYKTLSKNQIEEINKNFKKMDTTIRNMFACLSGSNPTGAETNCRASQMRCIDNEYFDCNFANVLKHFECNKKDKKKVILDELKTYKLVDMIKRNIIEGFSKIFFDYNIEYEYKDNIELLEMSESENENFNVVDTENKFRIKEKQKDFLLSIIYKTIDDYDDFINSNKYKIKLRSYYTANVNEYIKNKYIPLHSTTKLNNISFYDNAHIIPFSTSIKTLKYEDLFDAINPYNCLRIEKNIHKLFDDKSINFNINGDVVNRNNEILIEEYLNMNNMPKETKVYFKKYLDTLKT